MNSATPSANDRVPSIGSTTQTRRLLSRARSSSVSSDSQPSAAPRAQRVLEEAVDGEVGLGHQLARALLPALVRLAEVAHGDPPGLEHGGARLRRLALGNGAHVPATVRPSIRTVGASVLPWISRSEAGVSAWNICARLPAMVTSLTG